jgi:predicted cupin superfamily sugar epimerase
MASIIGGWSVLQEKKASANTPTECGFLSGGRTRSTLVYYGIPGNIASLHRFRYHVTRVWHKWLSRRSGKARIPWEHFGELERHYPLPPARLGRTRLVT